MYIPMLGVTAGGGGGHVPLCHPAESAPALEIHQLFSSKQTHKTTKQDNYSQRA